VAGVTRDVLPLFDAGAIRVVVDTVVPLRAAPRAHELLESKQTVGKLIPPRLRAHPANNCPILVTVDLSHGYLPRGPVHGVRPELLRLDVVRERSVRSVKLRRMACRA
jgi:hypothetical protein